MKYLKIIVIFILLLCFKVTAQDLTGTGIVKKVNDLLNQETMYAKVKMTIITTSGKERVFYYESYGRGEGEKSLIRYYKPAIVKNQAVLMLNNADDIWMYFPRTNRVRKMATHAKKRKMQGSDFSYEDMGSGDAFLTDFNHKRLKDEEIRDKECYKIELAKKEGVTSAYARIVMWVNKDNFLPVVIDYYDEDKVTLKLKRMILSDVKEVDGIPTPFKMTMKNVLDNTETVMEFLEVKYNVKLSDKMFTERGLKK